MDAAVSVASADAPASTDWWATMAAKKREVETNPDAPKPWLRRPKRRGGDGAESAGEGGGDGRGGGGRRACED